MFAKIKTYLNEHEDIFQLVKFAIFSMVAFVVEYLSFTVLVLCLKGINQSITWWIFNYNTQTGGLGALIAFLISTVLAQIVSFVINRKKTFNANNNVIFSAIMYAIMVCGIIILNTWLGATLTRAFNKIIANVTICQYIGKLIGSFAAFVITFVMNKFVIMRRKPEPKEKGEYDAALEAVASLDDEDIKL
jgi:putative flippase GtrA